MEPTIRGLQESGQRSGYPLVKFSGVLDSYYDEEDNFSNTQVHLNFTDMEVEEAVEPYPFPIAELTVKYSNYKRSGWGIFAESLAKCLGDDEDLPDLIGRKVTMAYTQGHDMGFKDKNWQAEVDDDGNATNESERPNVVIAAWEVIAVDGVGAGTAGVSPYDRLIELLDGKTRAEFNKAALSDPLIKAQGVAYIKAQITSRVFVSDAIKDGLFTEDENGVFHVVA